MIRPCAGSHASSSTPHSSSEDRSSSSASHSPCPRATTIPTQCVASPPPRLPPPQDHPTRQTPSRHVRLALCAALPPSAKPDAAVPLDAAIFIAFRLAATILTAIPLCPRPLCAGNTTLTPTRGCRAPGGCSSSATPRSASASSRTPRFDVLPFCFPELLTVDVGAAPHARRLRQPTPTASTSAPRALSIFSPPNDSALARVCAMDDRAG
ncbi:hypothetical protein DFH08DRAFT_894374 [Mycena albidolilacea]|uniref:Uncharacterized protein n=1 Tax=Mycena albidolilacea TaxID=1033008 RepID=A0AAD7EEW8_9AGAR|nr:hypothetical protein DFH08DRAFT_894374 [Mycena albidolilacea]